MIMSTYEVDDDEIESRLDEEESGSSDEEIPQTNNKGSPNNQNHGLVSWFNRNRKRTKSQETTAETESSDSVHVQIPPISSPVRRISVIAASAIKEGLDSITEGDFGSPGILVSFNNEEKEKGEYSRCRLNSDDSALTSSVVTTPEQAPNLKQRCPSMT
jgi:hypothetical protein